ncbi:RNA-directed DNA polymerase-like protein [Cucumis melo var. makuwa]|uniref:RNA-directed DNA polymerase-like protein n=1 Tax=Cucumis melo var. makuwa TaxID=1194695 RepID=A0A5A7VE97_CUCMM|nr:RNA-directed DNA polymerase-like protein [Cucumis melo var. makuwa]
MEEAHEVTTQTGSVPALQLKKELNREEPTFMVILLVDKQIQIRSQTPSENAYRMAPPKLVELKKQSDELLIVGFIRLAKLPFEAYVLSQKNKGRTLRLCIDYMALNEVTVQNRYGAFEFLVMPFGLTNAIGTFCTMMNKVLHEYLDQFVVVYLNAIMIFSPSLKELGWMRISYELSKSRELLLGREPDFVLMAVLEIFQHFAEFFPLLLIFIDGNMNK